MNEITISGFSDDIVSVQGDVSAEFYVYDEPCVLQIEPFGEIVTVEYTLDGIWEVDGPHRSEFDHFYAPPLLENVRSYSEAVVVTCEDDISVVRIE